MMLPPRTAFPLLLSLGLLVAGIFAMFVSYDWIGDPLIRDFESRRSYLEQLNRLADAAMADGSDLCENGSKTSKNPADIELRALLSKQHFFLTCLTQYPGEHLWDVPTGGLAGSGSVGYAFIPIPPDGARVVPINSSLARSSGHRIAYRHIVDGWYVYSTE